MRAKPSTHNIRGNFPLELLTAVDSKTILLCRRQGSHPSTQQQGGGGGEVHSDIVILTFDDSSASSWRPSGEMPLEEVMIEAEHFEM